MTSRLRVNPIACDGHGLCAELLPERIRLDDWGYPIVDDAPLDRELEGHARRAVDACPTLALQLVEADVHTRRRDDAGTAPPPARLGDRDRRSV
jgi:ferredoxin